MFGERVYMNDINAKVVTKTRKSMGFTLVELIIVIAIMAVLSGLIAPTVIRYIKKARASRATEDARTIVRSVENALATCATRDIDVIYNKQYVADDGTVQNCGIITDWILAKAQNEEDMDETDENYADYVISDEILGNLCSDSKNDFQFLKFTGSPTNPIGADCSEFVNEYGCPGLIIAYNVNGQVVLLEYYNYGVLVRYENGEYNFSENENFTGSSKLKYNAY
jgi:prepilin-type N-terminal cleavage/methylation domain-containing protein